MVCRLAQALGIKGEVKNTLSGVEINFESEKKQADEFKLSIQKACPQNGKIESMFLQVRNDSCQFEGFKIGASATQSYDQSFNVPADLALCSNCRDESLDKASRYHKYAFNACVHCGPRYTAIKSMPFHREQTSMSVFGYCDDCLQEFEDVHHSRFHSELQSCQTCGVELAFVDSNGRELGIQENAIMTASTWLTGGKILGVKGLGGFHLCCDATNEISIANLRQRKHRPEKPLAIMFSDEAHLLSYCIPEQNELEHILSPQAPIVLIDKSHFIQSFPNMLAPEVRCIGVMVAYSPLHMMLISRFKKPLVMTSGNVSGAPLVYNNDVALGQLSVIADGFLLHNREIIRPLDDSVVQINNGQLQMLRRARGYVPEAINLVIKANSTKDKPTQKQPIKINQGDNVLALGADLKNSFALCKNNKVVLSGHNGNLSHLDCYQSFVREIRSFCELYNFKPNAICIDSHPDYVSSQFGRQLAIEKNLPLIEAQHHHAHMVSCMVENQIPESKNVLALCLDGLGYGDASIAEHGILGCELLFGDYCSVQRLGGLKPFPLIGADKANVEPYRNLVALLAQSNCLALATGMATEMATKKSGGFDWLTANNIDREEVGQLQQIIQAPNKQFSPLCSSAGRLFDAVAALLGLVPKQLSFEGQGAQILESYACNGNTEVKGYPFNITKDKAKNEQVSTEADDEASHIWIIDTSPMWLGVLEDLRAISHVEKAEAQLQIISDIALKFHLGLAQALSALVATALKEFPQKLNNINHIALSGGCFQNRILQSALTYRLEHLELTVLTHHHVPAGDGGIALGQSAIARARLKA